MFRIEQSKSDFLVKSGNYVNFSQSFVTISYTRFSILGLKLIFKIKMRRRIFGNINPIYIIVAMVIIIAFLLLGGANWITGQLRGGGSGLNWPQILISLFLGFLIGLVACKRKWF